MGLNIQKNGNYYENNSRFIKDERLNSMNCNAPVNKEAAEKIAKKYYKTIDSVELSSNKTAQDRYEEYLKIMAFANPMLYTTPLFIYDAAKQKAEEQASLNKQDNSYNVEHGKKALSMLPGGWWFAIK